MTSPGRFLSAQWRQLAMLNYSVDPAMLAPFVPAGTELDSWGGTTYVSVVGFMFLKTRVLGLAIPFHCNFPEVNLRFYVRRRGVPGELHVDADGYKRGVVFAELDARKGAGGDVREAGEVVRYGLAASGERVGFFHADAKWSWMAMGHYDFGVRIRREADSRVERFADDAFDHLRRPQCIEFDAYARVASL